jgi:magnesium transporter
MQPAAFTVEFRIIRKVKLPDDGSCNRVRLQYLHLRLEIDRRFVRRRLVLHEWSFRISEQHLHLRRIGRRCDPQKDDAGRKRRGNAERHRHVHADAPLPQRASITFILTGRALITLRYVEPRPVAIYSQKLLRGQEGCSCGEEALVGLLESFIDRIADILEKVNQDLDQVSQTIFAEGPTGQRGGGRDLQAVIRALGRNDDLVSTIRESLLSLTRVISFLTATLTAVGDKSAKDMKARLKSARNDIVSLNEHAAFESHTINFQLDATLGMINIEQNGIIKIFSIAAVVFLPPTMVASIYGMNFKDMPELNWTAGYPWALGLMLVSALVPLIYFKRKGWL